MDDIQKKENAARVTELMKGLTKFAENDPSLWKIFKECHTEAIDELRDWLEGKKLKRKYIISVKYSRVERAYVAIEKNTLFYCEAPSKTEALHKLIEVLMQYRK